MKRIFLACVAQCYCLSALASFDFQYHAEPPLDNKIADSYQQKRSGLKHKIWSAEALTQANDEAIAQEQQRAAADLANRKRHNTQYGEYRCGKTSNSMASLVTLRVGRWISPHSSAIAEAGSQDQNCRRSAI
nr:hypothetical protein [Serratia proteamaculans]